MERFGCRLLGVDLARHGFAARRRAAADPSLGGRVRYVQGRLEALPVAAGGCDLVWCRDALSCADPDRTLRELARVVHRHPLPSSSAAAGVDKDARS